jgi:hypothetical protein
MSPYEKRGDIEQQVTETLLGDFGISKKPGSDPQTGYITKGCRIGQQTPGQRSS